MCSSGLFWVWTMIVVLDCCLHRNAGYKTLSGSGPVSAYCLCSEQLLVKRKWSKRIIIGCRAHRNFRAANQNVAIKFRAKTWRVAAVASQAKILQQSKRLVDSEQHLQNEICHMFLFSWRYIYQRQPKWNKLYNHLIHTQTIVDSASRHDTTCGPIK